MGIGATSVMYAVSRDRYSCTRRYREMAIQRMPPDSQIAR